MRQRELLLDTLAYLAPAKAIAGLTAEDAGRRVDGAPHTIAELIAHVTFWQEWFLLRATGHPAPMPPHAGAGWPAPGDWTSLEQRFLASLESLASLDAAGPVEPPFDFAPMAAYTKADVVQHAAVHTAHHLGQVVLLRQLLGLWPPPAGPWTW